MTVVYAFPDIIIPPAYIDAGTGVIIIQFLIAGVATGLFFIGKFWRKVISLFRRNNRNDE